MVTITRIGALLKKLRGSRSLREIERLSGVSHTYLSSIEKGVDPRSGNEIVPTPETLRKLADAYDYSYSELMILAGHWSRDDLRREINLFDWIADEDDLEDIVKYKPGLTFLSRPLNEDDRKRILDMLAILFPDRK